MLLKEKVDSIRNVGSKMIYFESLILYLAIFSISYFESLKTYAITIMLWSVIIILFSRISVLMARQNALLRHIANSSDNGSYK